MRKRQNITPEDVERWISQGFGQGIGRSYRPFFHVRDVPSRGRSTMVLGMKTGRIHHYLSDLEFSCHILAEYALAVTDIREQFALLPWHETQTIADILGIRHPSYPGTKTPVVMTSDLVLIIEGEQAAVICVKPYSEIDPANPRAKRTLEKLLIEKTYWDRRNIPWQLITEREIPATRVRNLNQFRMSMMAEEQDWLNTYMGDFVTAFNASWKSEFTFLTILNMVATKINLTRDNCFALFSRAVWLRILDVDIDARVIHHDETLPRSIGRGASSCWK